MYIKIVGLLLTANILCCINKKTSERISACYYALQINNIQAFQNLLIKDYFYKYHLFESVHFSGHMGSTTLYDALHNSAQKSQLSIVLTKFLEKLKDEIDHGISPHILNPDLPLSRWFWYRCYQAIRSDNIRKLHELLTHDKFYKYLECPISLRFGIYGDYKEMNLIQMAIQRGNNASIRLICYLYAKNLSTVIKNNVTATQKPAYLCQLYKSHKKNKKLVSLTRLFLTHKLTDINETDEDGKTALHYAPPIVVEYLIQNGADINKSDVTGVTPLMHLASRHANKTGSLRCLLTYHPDLNKQDNKGWTALHWALLSREPIHIKMLLDSGADPSIKNIDGESPLDWTIGSPNANGKYAHHLLQHYPYVALRSQNFAVDPYQYSSNYSGFIRANTTQIIRNREITGKKHSYTKYKKVILMHTLKPQNFFKSTNKSDICPISLVSIPLKLNALRTGTRIAELN